MHSEHKIPFSWEPLPGVRSTSHQPKKIYLRKTLPTSDENLDFYKDSYIILTNEKLDVAYVDAQGKIELIDKKNNDAFHKAMSSEVQRIVQLDALHDFYIVPKSENTLTPDAILAKVVGVKNPKMTESEGAFVLHNNNLYYVNKAKNKIYHLDKLSEKEVPYIAERLGIRDFTPSKVTSHKLQKSKTDFMMGLIRQARRGVTRPVDSKTPITEIFSPSAVDAVQSFINSQPGHTEGQYNLYRAEVDPKLYFPHKGDLIADEFQTVTEIKDESFLDWLKKYKDKTIANPIWRDAQIKILLRELENEATKPENYVKALGKLATTLIGMLTKGHHGIDMDMMVKRAEEALHKKIQSLYDKKVIEPREGRAFPIAGEITIADMKRRDLAAELKSASGNPFDIMQMWIVSDVDPAIVAKEGAIKATAGHSYGCATEMGAIILADKIKQNQLECARLVAATPIQLTSEDNIKSQLRDLFYRKDAIDDLIIRQAQYVSQYNKISIYAASAPVSTEMDKIINIEFSDYIHFDQVFKIQEQCDKLVGLLMNPGKLVMDIEEVNKQLKEMYRLCQDYVAQHSYKNKESDPVFDLLNRLELLKENLELARKSEQGMNPAEIFSALHIPTTTESVTPTPTVATPDAIPATATTETTVTSTAADKSTATPKSDVTEPPPEPVKRGPRLV